jgi:hypothetical protein
MFRLYLFVTSTRMFGLSAELHDGPVRRTTCLQEVTEKLSARTQSNSETIYNQSEQDLLLSVHHQQVSSAQHRPTIQLSHNLHLVSSCNPDLLHHPLSRNRIPHPKPSLNQECLHNPYSFQTLVSVQILFLFFLTKTYRIGYPVAFRFQGTPISGRGTRRPNSIPGTFFPKVHTTTLPIRPPAGLSLLGYHGPPALYPNKLQLYAKHLLTPSRVKDSNPPVLPQRATHR